MIVKVLVVDNQTNIALLGGVGVDATECSRQVVDFDDDRGYSVRAGGVQALLEAEDSVWSATLRLRLKRLVTASALSRKWAPRSLLIWSAGSYGS